MQLVYRRQCQSKGVNDKEASIVHPKQQAFLGHCRWDFGSEQLDCRHGGLSDPESVPLWPDEDKLRRRGHGIQQHQHRRWKCQLSAVEDTIWISSKRHCPGNMINTYLLIQQCIFKLDQKQLKRIPVVETSIYGFMHAHIFAYFRCRRPSARWSWPRSTL